jgi:hypothetical protein
VIAGTEPVLVHNCNTAEEGLRDVEEKLDIVKDADSKVQVMARLDVGGRSFYDVNNHKQAYQRPASVMPQSMSHAESGAFMRAANSGIQGGAGQLYVAGLIPCRFCRSSLAGWAKHLDLDELHVYGPNGYIGSYYKGAPPGIFGKFFRPGRFKTLNRGDNKL